MKKAIIIVIAAIMLFSMAACGGHGAQAMLEGSWYDEMGMLKMVFSEKCTIYCYMESSVDPKTKEYAYEYSEGILRLTDEANNTAEFEVTLSGNGRSIDSISYNLEDTQICFSHKEASPKELAVYQLQLALLASRLSLVEFETDAFVKAANTTALENDIGTLKNTIMAYILMMDDLNMDVDLSQ